MLDADSSLLCSKLCRHNVDNATLDASGFYNICVIIIYSVIFFPNYFLYIHKNHSHNKRLTGLLISVNHCSYSISRSKSWGTSSCWPIYFPGVLLRCSKMRHIFLHRTTKGPQRRLFVSSLNFEVFWTTGHPTVTQYCGICQVACSVYGLQWTYTQKML